MTVESKNLVRKAALALQVDSELEDSDRDEDASLDTIRSTRTQMRVDSSGQPHIVIAPQSGDDDAAILSDVAGSVKAHRQEQYVLTLARCPSQDTGMKPLCEPLGNGTQYYVHCCEKPCAQGKEGKEDNGTVCQDIKQEAWTKSAVDWPLCGTAGLSPNELRYISPGKKSVTAGLHSKQCRVSCHSYHGEGMPMKSWEDAEEFCSASGYTLCSAEEITSNIQCDAGCEFKGKRIWTSTNCEMFNGSTTVGASSETTTTEEPWTTGIRSYQTTAETTTTEYKTKFPTVKTTTSVGETTAMPGKTSISTGQTTTAIGAGGETTSGAGGATTTSGTGGETTSGAGGETTSGAGGATTTSGAGEETTSGAGGETTTSGAGGETTSGAGGETTTSGAGGATTTSGAGEKTTFGAGGETTTSGAGEATTTTSGAGGETTASGAGEATTSAAEETTTVSGGPTTTAFATTTVRVETTTTDAAGNAPSTARNFCKAQVSQRTMTLIGSAVALTTVAFSRLQA